MWLVPYLFILAKGYTLFYYYLLNVLLSFSALNFHIHFDDVSAKTLLLANVLLVLFIRWLESRGAGCSIKPVCVVQKLLYGYN